MNTRDLIKQFGLPNGLDFCGLQIPEWQNIKQLVVQTHYKLAHFQLINWDIAIQEDGTPIVVEYNLIDASVSFHQLNVGPIFGELTEEVLMEIGGK